jgi:hypothetical protein
VEAFAAGALGFTRAANWGEAVSTALLERWADSLTTDGVLTPAALKMLKADARRIHRKLRPLDQGRINRRRRVMYLDKRLGDGLCLGSLAEDSRGMVGQGAAGPALRGEDCVSHELMRASSGVTYPSAESG